MRRAALVAAMLLTFFVVLMVAGAALAVRNGEAAVGKSLAALFAVPFASVGTLLVWRRPRNPIGWIMAAISLSFALWFLARQYAVYALVTTPGALPGGVLALWSSTGWADLGWALAFTFLPLLFPDGALPSPRWRAIAWLAGTLVVINVAQGQIFVHHDLEVPPGSYPFGLSPNPELRERLNPFYLAAMVAIGIACFVAPFARFRAAATVERQQLKWFIFAITALLAGLVIFSLRVAVEGGNPQLGQTASPLSVLEGVFLVGAVLGVPIAIGIAILRYRLYDIDLLINRTVVYGATSAAIGATFFAGIVGLQAVISPLTSGSELAVAASTLVSFALFQPIRRRVQDAVDRRFDRSRYDAARTLDAFADRLRDEVDLDALRANLIGAVPRRCRRPTRAYGFVGASPLGTVVAARVSKLPRRHS